MTQTRNWVIALTVFVAALAAGYGLDFSRQAFAQDKVPKTPVAIEEPALPEPVTPELVMPEPTAKTPSSEPTATPPREEPARPENFVELRDEPEMPEPVTAMPEPVTAMPEPATIPVTDIPNQGDLMGRITAAQAELAAGFEPGEAEAFREMLASGPDQNGAAFIGQMLYMRRHFDRAAWFFAEAVRNDPNDAAALNNFGVMLDETYVADPDNRPASWVSVGADAVARAGALRPDDVAIGNNFARGQLHLAQIDPDAADLEAATAALTRATDAEQDNIIFLTNQALVLDAMGEVEAAARALAEAHELSPHHPSFLTASSQVSPATSGAYSGAPRNYCSVNYYCGERCPPSIIGQINRVTCETEQSSAQMACGAGEPYALNFNCAEQIPEFGILIPGLNAGFTVASPWGSIAAVVDGQGNVQWRVEAGPNLGPINPYIRVDGGYQPEGGWSVSDTRAGVKVNLVNGSPAGRTAGEWGYQPLYVQAEGSAANQSAEVSAGAYGNATILH